ncbi:MAG: four helix bundle protein [Alphaproteobacteria bacterium]|nr:four helix bundle protein [Alphaproteobacteria bacterium]MCB9190598.1 four helix bundle protein [Flavobacteriales bacterium]
MGEFRELKVWQKARILRNECAKLARTSFPKEEKFLLTDQLIRSSRAVTAMITEGHGRYHYQENIQRLRMARGELVETMDHLTVALDEGYVPQEKFDELLAISQEVEKMINGYIRYLNNAKSEDD